AKMSSEVAPTLIGLLADTDAGVRDAAAKGLSAIDPAWPRTDAARKTVPALAGRLGDGNSRVRLAAAVALGRVGFGAGAAAGALAELLDDPDASVQTAADEALLSVDVMGPHSVDARKTLSILRRELSDTDASVRQQAVKMLGQLGQRAVRAVPNLIPLLAD